jgi:hypothetical protein
VAFFFTMGEFEEIRPEAEALDAAITAIGKPSVHWHEANTTGVETLAAAIEELVAGEGTDEVGAEGALGAEAFENDGFGSEGLAEDFPAEDFGREGSSVEGFGR